MADDRTSTLSCHLPLSIGYLLSVICHCLFVCHAHRVIHASRAYLGRGPIRRFVSEMLQRRLAAASAEVSEAVRTSGSAVVERA